MFFPAELNLFTQLLSFPRFEKKVANSCRNGTHDFCLLILGGLDEKW
jgi:hypothetical protein